MTAGAGRPEDRLGKVRPGGRAGAAWPARRAAQVGHDPDRLVFRDEAWATTRMSRGTTGADAGRVPHGHGTATTLVAPSGRTGGRPRWASEGPRPGAGSWLASARFRPPGLRPGDVGGAGNRPCHWRVEAPRAIEAAGCRVAFLPPRGPGRYPVELASSRPKATSRRRESRTVTGQWAALGQPLDRFPADACRHSPRPAGYKPRATEPGSKARARPVDAVWDACPRPGCGGTGHVGRGPRRAASGRRPTDPVPTTNGTTRPAGLPPESPPRPTAGSRPPRSPPSTGPASAPPRSPR